VLRGATLYDLPEQEGLSCLSCCCSSCCFSVRRHVCGRNVGSVCGHFVGIIIICPNNRVQLLIAPNVSARNYHCPLPAISSVFIRVARAVVVNFLLLRVPRAAASSRPCSTCSRPSRELRRFLLPLLCGWLSERVGCFGRGNTVDSFPGSLVAVPPPPWISVLLVFSCFGIRRNGGARAYNLKKTAKSGWFSLRQCCR